METGGSWKRLEKSVTASFKRGNKDDLGNYMLANLSSIPGNIMKQIILEITSKYIKGKKVTESTQHGFTKGRSCPTWPDGLLQQSD